MSREEQWPCSIAWPRDLFPSSVLLHPQGVTWLRMAHFHNSALEPEGKREEEVEGQEDSFWRLYLLASCITLPITWSLGYA